MAKDKTLKLLIQVGGKVDKSLMATISQTTGAVSGFSRELSKIGTAGLAAMGAFAAGTVAALVKCTNAAADFQSDMADVVKYVDGLADATGRVSDKMAGNGKTFKQNYEEMSGVLLDLSTQIPMTAEELTQLAAAAGQSGKGITDLYRIDDKGNIQGFLRDVAMMGTAMDISAEQAGDWAAKWEVMLNMDHDQVMVLADQINYLGANKATTAAEIAEVVNSAASLGQVAGMSADSTAALATAMLAMGVPTAKAGSSINRIYTNMSKGASATKAQKKMWEELGFTAEGIAKSMQTDATSTLKSVFTAIQQLPDERRVAALSTLFGQWAITGAAKITGNLGAFTDALDMVNDPSLYTGSMEREFTIKTSTSEALDEMMGNTLQALQIDIGTAFLPAKQEITSSLIDFINDIRDMPQLGEIASQLATLFSQGVQWAGDALEKALPYIQQALDYLINNGPEVVSILGKIAAAFAAMKFAPQIEGLVKGVGGLGGMIGNAVLGTPQVKGGRSGGLLGLFKGGQNFFGGGGLGNLLSGGKGMLSSLAGTMGGIGGYFGGIGKAAGNFAQQSGLAGFGKTALEVLKNIAGPGNELGQGLNLTGAWQGIKNAGAGALNWVGGKAGAVMQSAPVQAIGGFVGNVAQSAPVQGLLSMGKGAAGWMGNTLGAGAGLLGNIWGPVAGGFGSLLSGALPVVGVISSIIAVVSLLWDNIDALRGPIEAVFGEKGLAVFDSFKNGLDGIFGFIQGLFDGGLADALSGVRDMFAGAFEGESPLSNILNTLFGGQEGGLAAFDGLVQVIQSVLGVIGQVVTFANTTVKPIIQEIFSFITQTVAPIIIQTFTAAAPVISGIISNLGSAIMTVAQIIGTAIQAVLPIVESIITVIMNVGQVVIPAVLAYIEQFTAGIQGVIEGIQQVFQGLIDFITGVFTGNWEQAWNGIKEIFGGVFDALVNLCKAPINAVIALINKAISGINGLGLTIPDWVPVIGGKSFSINIPTIPMLENGGFTKGPSIAGEAGTEAVISFKASERAQNIDTWMRAGHMLGMRTLEEIPAEAMTGNAGGGGQVVFAPQITVQGNADRGMMEEVMQNVFEQFQTWYQQMQRQQARRAY